MSQELKNNWFPTGKIRYLQVRANILRQIRQFFLEHDVLEVETPLMARSGNPDPYILSLTTQPLLAYATKPETFYLQTSPEFAMKRLLAAGYPSIYQIAKAFRDNEQGRYHNPEFTLLEWYRLGFTHHDLMDEVDAFLQRVLKTQPAERLNYADMFLKYCKINPYEADIEQLIKVLKHCQIVINTPLDNTDDYLQLIMSEYIEPQLGDTKPVFVYDYPASQAALAKISKGTQPAAERFEVYYKGIELANGFHELQSQSEQRERFIGHNIERKKKYLPEIPLDEYFLDALSHGLPDCAGVALGVDRLVMLACGVDKIADVISFTTEIA